MMNGEEGLDFGGAVATTSQKVYSDSLVIPLVLGTILLYAALVAGSIWFARAHSKRPPPRVLPNLRDFPAPLKVLTFGVCVSTLLVEVIAVIDMIVQTRVIQPSAYEYFQYLSYARLLGTSHAHLFGFMVLYGCLALLLCFSSAPEGLKHFMIPLVMWAGVFDVMSWWGMKAISVKFDWLAMVTGSCSGTSSLVIVFFILRDLRLRSLPA